MPRPWTALALVVLVIAIMEALRAVGIHIPNPPALLMPVVVLVAFSAGLRAGLAVSAAAVLYNIYAFSQPGALGNYVPADLTRVVVWGVITPFVAWMVGYLRDRLERVEHAALEASEARFLTTFSASPVAMAVTRLADGRVMQANASFRKLLQLSGGDPLPRFEEFLVPPQPVATLPSQQAELTLRARDGSEVLALASFEQIELAGEACRLGFFYDVTERRRLEDSLRQAQKMEAIGRLAGGVAHDFNNLLTVINGNAALLADQEHDAERRTLALEIAEAGERAASLTRQLLTFARRQAPRVVEISLNDVVSESVPLLKRLLPANINLSLSLAEQRCVVRVDPTHLQQVLLNLVTNARDAMLEAGGQLTLSTTVEEDPPHGSTASLLVRDTGPGIPADVVPHLFEPFFTTKAVGRGTGLGLATVYSAVKQAQGHVTVDTALGRGTTFCVALPRVPEPAAGRSTFTVSPGQAGGTETILLVEDEPSVRRVAVRALEGRGYTVLEAKCAEEALALARQHAFHLLVTDVMMPGMNGRDLALALQKEHPLVRVLFVSGHSAPEVDQAMVKGGATLLAKPFTADVLAATVRTILNSTPGPVERA